MRFRAPVAKSLYHDSSLCHSPFSALSSPLHSPMEALAVSESGRPIYAANEVEVCVLENVEVEPLLPEPGRPHTYWLRLTTHRIALQVPLSITLEPIASLLRERKQIAASHICCFIVSPSSLRRHICLLYCTKMIPVLIFQRVQPRSDRSC